MQFTFDYLLSTNLHMLGEPTESDINISVSTLLSRICFNIWWFRSVGWSRLFLTTHS